MIKIKNEKDRSFHMDKGRLVCNGCGFAFANLVLFENHTHSTGQLQSDTTPVRTGPKTQNRRFDDMSNAEMLEAFHKMPELNGCWFDDGFFYCCQCGKCFENPYILFSHKIIHPPHMKIGRSFRVSDVEHNWMFQKRSPRTSKYLKKRIGEFENDFDEDDDDNMQVDDDVPDDDGLNVRYEVTIVDKKSRVDGIHVSSNIKTEPLSEGDNMSLSQQLMLVDAIEEASTSTAIAHGAGTTVVKEEVIKCDIGEVSTDTVKVEQVSVDIKEDVVNESPDNSQITIEPIDDKTKVKVAETVSEDDSDDDEEEGDEPTLATSTNTKLDLRAMTRIFTSLPGLENCNITDLGQFACDVCSESMDTPFQLFTHRLLEHILGMHNVGTFEASHIVFANLPGLENCSISKFGYDCDMCSVNFPDPYTLFTHRVYDHGQRVTSFSDLNLELCKFEDGQYVCDECSKLYKSAHLLLNHKMLHKKLKIRALRRCKPYAFIDYENEDMWTSTNDEMCYNCNMCRNQFESLDGLKIHVENHLRKINYKFPDMFQSTMKDEISPSIKDEDSMKLKITLTQKAVKNFQKPQHIIVKDITSANYPKRAFVRLERLDMGVNDVRIVSDTSDLQ